MMYQSTTRVVSTARPAPKASQSTAMRTSARRATSERDTERKRFRSCSPVVVGGTSIRRDPSEVSGGGSQEPAESAADASPTVDPLCVGGRRRPAAGRSPTSYGSDVTDEQQDQRNQQEDEEPAVHRNAADQRKQDQQH